MTDDGDDLIHRYCCNPDVALCGTDLSGEDDCEVTDETECIVCAHLLLVGDCTVTCPVVVFT